MATWAAIALSEPPKLAPPPVEAVGKGEVVSIIDANAIISGLSIRHALERLVTTPEVLEEVRDKRSRQRLEALPFKIEALEPNEESVRAVTRFARATGDMHSLSTVDIRLIALTHTLETAAYGAGHLRELPAAPRPQSRRPRANARLLPGWDAQGEGWQELDQLAEEEEEAAEAARRAGGAAGVAEDEASASRIIASIQALDLNSGIHRLDLSGTIADGASQHDVEDGAAQQPAGGAAVGSEAGVAAVSGVEGGSDEAGWTDDDSEEEDVQWQVVAKSQNSARRKKRRGQRRAAWEAIHGASSTAAGESVPCESQGCDAAELSDSDAEGSDSDAGEADRAEVDGVSDASSDGGEGAESEVGPRFESSVSCVTADFAMQNVILQMGLRLLAPDGRAITRLSRYVLRCSACFFVTKEVGRLFCPRCGNATVERVEVVIGPDGQEQYGVRRKHILRGTRFSLPKPKGGRAGRKEPILREDVLLQRMPHMRPRTVEDVDAFAPEYGQDSWHQKHATSEKHEKGAAAVLASWKHNPNERKHVRTNRRRK